ncbi:unnamed protein product [Rotaria sp. Silwood2]|nr:unnamed protein product [Rotaria sp. Silwood2]CAF4557055.1 unnamed protein product [Rotaria sp. Silwood2]
MYSFLFLEIRPYHDFPFRSIILPYEPQLSEQQSPFVTTNDESTVGTTIPIDADPQPCPGTNILQRTTDELRSPDTLGLHTLDNIITESLVDAFNNDTQYEKSPVPRQLSHNSKKRCPICNYEFLDTTDEVQIYTHVETCLISASMDDLGPFDGPRQFECPICNQQFSGNDDKAYREHLSDCYREPGGNS